MQGHNDTPIRETRVHHANNTCHMYQSSGQYLTPGQDVQADGSWQAQHRNPAPLRTAIAGIATPEGQIAVGTATRLCWKHNKMHIAVFSLSVNQQTRLTAGDAPHWLETAAHPPTRSNPSFTPRPALHAAFRGQQALRERSQWVCSAILNPIMARQSLSMLSRSSCTQTRENTMTPKSIFQNVGRKPPAFETPYSASTLTGTPPSFSSRTTATTTLYFRAKRPTIHTKVH